MNAPSTLIPLCGHCGQERSLDPGPCPHCQGPAVRWERERERWGFNAVALAVVLAWSVAMIGCFLTTLQLLRLGQIQQAWPIMLTAIACGLTTGFGALHGLHAGARLGGAMLWERRWRALLDDETQAKVVYHRGRLLTGHGARADTVPVETSALRSLPRDRLPQPEVLGLPDTAPREVLALAALICRSIGDGLLVVEHQHTERWRYDHQGAQRDDDHLFTVIDCRDVHHNDPRFEVLALIAAHLPVTDLSWHVRYPPDLGELPPIDASANDAWQLAQAHEPELVRWYVEQARAVYERLHLGGAPGRADVRAIDAGERA